MTEFLLYLYAESPVHAGAADSIDVLDLPVQREAATGYPVIWGQSLKGALRQAACDAGEGSGWGKDRIEIVFGSAIESPDENGGTRAGMLAVGDAQLVAMPVPALRHTFAWLTSEIALGRLARKYALLGREVHPVPRVRSSGGAAASAEWTQASEEVLGPCLVPLGGDPDESLAAWAGQVADDALVPDGGALMPPEAFRPFADKLRRDLVLVGADIVPTLLSECTEQAVRIQLDEFKIVAEGPFYSEYLPAETLLTAALALRGRGDTPENRQALRGLLHETLLQVGGDETLGKGIMWTRLLEGRPS